MTTDIVTKNKLSSPVKVLRHGRKKVRMRTDFFFTKKNKTKKKKKKKWVNVSANIVLFRSVLFSLKEPKINAKIIYRYCRFHNKHRYGGEVLKSDRFNFHFRIPLFVSFR